MTSAVDQLSAVPTKLKGAFVTAERRTRIFLLKCKLFKQSCTIWIMLSHRGGGGATQISEWLQERRSDAVIVVSFELLSLQQTNVYCCKSVICSFFRVRYSQRFMLNISVAFCSSNTQTNIKNYLILKSLCQKWDICPPADSQTIRGSARRQFQCDATCSLVFIRT